MENEIPQPIAILGGTGRLGPGLARHLAAAGIDIIIGSREASRAEATAETIRGRAGPTARVRGMDNTSAAAAASVVILTVPPDGADDLLEAVGEALVDTVVISTIVPMVFVDGAPSYAAPDAGSAAQSVAERLPQSRVAAAFHTVSSRELDHDAPLDADTLVLGDDADACEITAKIAELIPGLRAVVAGPLRYARHAEGITVLLLGINKRHRTSAGVRLTNVDATRGRS